MTREEFINKARDAGLLEPGIRLGMISPTQIMYNEVRSYFRSSRRMGVGYVDAVQDASAKFGICYSYVTRIVGGL